MCQNGSPRWGFGLASGLVGFELDSVFDCFLRVFLLGAWLLFLGVGCLLVFVGFCFMKSSFLSGFLASNCFFSESLILAQDERWRRA